MPHRARSLKGTRFILAQFVPMLVLGIAYLFVQDELRDTYLGGVSLNRLLLLSAIIAPLLSQAATGPLFRSLETTTAREFSQTAELTLRNLPRALMLAAPVLALVGFGIAAALGLDLRATAALLAVAWLHLLFAASLVPAYAHRRGGLLVLGWSTYAVTLAVAAGSWWAPPVAAAGSQLVVLATRARTPLSEVELAGHRPMVVGMTRGLSLSLPLWCLPVAVYLGSQGELSPFAIFVALVPAVLGYQVYFVLIATPAWTRIDAARDLLAQQPYARARTELVSIGSQMRRGVRHTLGLVGVLLLAVSALLAAWPQRQGPELLQLTACACLSVVLIAEVVRLVMVHDGPAAYVVSALVCLPVAGVAAGGYGVTPVVVTHAAMSLLCLSVLTLVNRRVWRSPEYSLFWARALHA